MLAILARSWISLPARCRAASTSSRNSKLVQAVVSGIDRAIQSRGKKSTSWLKDPIRPEIDDAEAIVRSVRAGRMDKSLVPHLRDSTPIACLVLSRLILPDQAVAFFLWAAKQDGFKHDVTSANQLLESLVRGGRAVDAYAIFKQRFSQMFKPNAFTYTVLVRGLCDDGKVGEACELFNDMHRHGGIKAKLPIYALLLNGLLRAGKLDDAFSYFQMMQESCPPDTATYSTMIYELSKQGSLDHAAKVAEDMVEKENTPDIPSLGVAVELLCQKGRVSDAWKLLRLMREKHAKPDTVMHTYVIRKFCEAGDLEQALKGFEEMCDNEKVQPDFVTYSIVVDGLCSAQRIDDATKFMERMVEDRKMPDVPTFWSLLESHNKPRLVEDREKIEDGKLEKLTTTMYTLLMYGLFRMGRAEDALELYQQVLSGPTGPRLLTYWVMIDGLSGCGRALEAGDVFSVMIERGTMPQTKIYNALIAGFCRIGRVERALELLRDMPQKQCMPESATYNALLDGLRAAGRAEDAISVFMEASERGVKIDPASFPPLHKKSEGIGAQV